MNATNCRHPIGNYYLRTENSDVISSKPVSSNSDAGLSFPPPPFARQQPFRGSYSTEHLVATIPNIVSAAHSAMHTLMSKWTLSVMPIFPCQQTLPAMPLSLRPVPSLAAISTTAAGITALAAQMLTLPRSSHPACPEPSATAAGITASRRQKTLRSKPSAASLTSAALTAASLFHLCCLAVQDVVVDVN